MVETLVLITVVALIVHTFVCLAYFVSSIWEKEKRASIFAGLQLVLPLGLLGVVLYLSGSGFFDTISGMVLLGAGVILKMFKFQSAPDQVYAFRKASIGELTKSEWPKLKAELDRGRPTILVLVRAKKLFDNPTKNHQLLAVGYRFDPTRRDLTIYEYDPNQKNKMMTLEMNLGLPDGKLYLIDQAYRGTRGFFVSDAVSIASRKMKL